MRRAILGLAAALAVLVAAAGAYGAPFDWGSRDWEGGSDLVELARAELGFSRVIVANRLDYHELAPTDGLLIVHPARTLDVEAISRFLKAGGRVVLLDDYGTGEPLLQHFGMERVPLPEQPERELRQNPALAIAEPASAHPAVLDVAHVVTNHATGIKHPDLTPILEVRDAQGHPTYLAVAGAVGQGRLLAVGDASIVMNSMLRYGGNKAFARNLLRYAAEDDANGHGSGRVFLATGDFDQTGSFGDEGSSGWLGERVRAMKDALDSLRSEGMPPGLSYALAVLVGLGVVWWTGSRAGKTHKASTPRFTRAVPMAAQGGVAGHAAVVGGHRAPRLLAMLELKSALEEDLCQALGADENPGHEEIVSMLRARGWLDDGTLAQLRALLLRMATVETMMLSQRAGATMQPVRDREVMAASRDVRRIVGAARESARLAAAQARGGS